MVEADAAIAKQRHGKPISTAMTQHTTKELSEVVLSVWSVPRSYNKDQQEG